jgi:hypothetical protein
MSSEAEIARTVLMYFVLPLWLVMGFADWLSRRGARIETSGGGPKETLIHLLLFVEMLIPVVAGMTLEINALVLLLMIVFLFIYQATAVGGVFYAHRRHRITVAEQYAHGYLMMIPLLSVIMVVVLHWPQFLALLGLGSEALRLDIILKEPPLPEGYVISIIAAVVLLDILPFIEELVRGLRANDGRFELSQTAASQGQRSHDR